MFGIANQMLAVIALSVVTAYLAIEGRTKYLWVTVLPLLFVATTTFTAGAEMLSMQINGIKVQMLNAPADRNTAILVQSVVLGGLIFFMLGCGAIIILAAASKVWKVMNGIPQTVQIATAAT